jgi:hypothetical protein
METKAPIPTSVVYLTSENYATYTAVTYEQVVSALGYTPYDETNPSKFISGIDSLMVTDALGYTPYDSANPKGYIDSNALVPYLTSEKATATYQPIGEYLTTISGLNISELTNDSKFISGIDSLMVTDALGYTPYDSTNPDEFITVRALEGYVPFSGASVDLDLGTHSVSGVIKSLASSVDFAGLNVPSGIAPINPIEGDIWLEGGVLYIVIEGITYNFQLQTR